MRRWIGYGLLGIASAVVLLTITAFLVLGRFDLGPIAARRASAVLGRPVTIAGLHVTPGRWITIELQGVHVANLPGGTQPEMAGLATLTAEVEALSLLHGPVNVRGLKIQGLSLLLEHVAGGAPNWRRDNAAPAPGGQEDRSWFPTLLDAHLSDSEITDRTSSGHALVIRLDDATIHAAAPDAPVRLEVTGAFREIPIHLEADLQSIAVLRDAAKPYGTDLLVSSGDTTLRFKGSMTHPLAVDGANGQLTLTTPTAGPLLAMMGSQSDFRTSLDLTGTLTRSDALWVLADATGRWDSSTLAASTLRLVDGARGQADHVELDLSFDRLNLDPLLAAKRGDKTASTPFTVEQSPDPLLKAQIAARQLSYGRREATNLDVSAEIAPGQIKVDKLAMVAFGARLQVSGHADSADKGGQLFAEGSLVNASIEQLVRQTGASAVPLQGALNAQAVAEARGETLEAALQSARISTVVWMSGGRIPRDLIEKASLDIRRLFRAPKGMSEVTCLLGIVIMQGGEGTISPLRIRTADGTIAGQGRFDLNRGQLDVTAGSQSSTTSDFALDVPFRISGAFSNPSVRPFAGRVALASADLSNLPPALRPVARRNPCLSPR